MATSREIDIQWEAEICFSYLGHKHMAWICAGPFSSLEKVRQWQKSFVSYLVYNCKGKKGIRWQLLDQKVQEFFREEVHLLIIRHPSWTARNIFSEAVIELTKRIVA